MSIISMVNPHLFTFERANVKNQTVIRYHSAFQELKETKPQWQVATQVLN
jgi:hypothetical protein